MTLSLGPSWKTTLSGVLTILVPPAIYALLTQAFKMKEQDALSISGALMTILAGLGLANAKDAGVSNSPHPIPEAQPVEKMIALKKASPPVDASPRAQDAAAQSPPPAPSNGKPYLE